MDAWRDADGYGLRVTIFRRAHTSRRARPISSGSSSATATGIIPVPFASRLPLRFDLVSSKRGEPQLMSLLCVVQIC